MKQMTFENFYQHDTDIYSLEGFSPVIVDRAFLEKVPGCGEDGKVLCCLRVSCPGREDVLVVPDGTGHVALAALA